GKSMFAKELGSMLKIKVSHLDRLFWQRGWEEKTGFARKEILEKLISEKQWIIDGNYFRFATLHVKAADTIIFLEMPSFLCFCRSVLDLSDQEIVEWFQINEFLLFLRSNFPYDARNVSANSPWSGGHVSSSPGRTRQSDRACALRRRSDIARDAFCTSGYESI